MIDSGEIADGRATCGICGRTTPLYTLDELEARERARECGWRFVGEWAWTCPTCALGSPGIYVVRENERRAQEAADQEPEPEPEPEVPSWIREARRRDPAAGPSQLGDVLRSIFSELPDVEPPD